MRSVCQQSRARVLQEWHVAAREPPAESLMACIGLAPHHLPYPTQCFRKVAPASSLMLRWKRHAIRFSILARIARELELWRGRPHARNKTSHRRRKIGAHVSSVAKRCSTVALQRHTTAVDGLQVDPCPSRGKRAARFLESSFVFRGRSCGCLAFAGLRQRG